MKRTIEMKNNHVYYRGKKIGYVLSSTSEFFGLKNARVYKYAVTITEGTQYIVENSKYEAFYYLKNAETGASLGLVCKEIFDRLFFVLNLKKRYNVTVKKIRKK